MRHLLPRTLIAVLLLCSFACMARTSTDTVTLSEEIDFHTQIANCMVSLERIMHSTNARSTADCRASQRAMQDLLTGVRGLDLPSTDQSYYRTLRYTTERALILWCESLDPDRALSSRIEAGREAQVLIDECTALVERKRKEIE